eukprot:gb/GEZN01012899.1/.p1 GENE.gb/GEZN01012899.1/~~gb/GEZN01012899.1/.p1  ORF type:complete len:295 (-),score=59.90 gb/GEZN01012899.1/:141-1025(-)
MPPKSKKAAPTIAENLEGSTYKIDEEVISTHRGHLYEAKVLKMKATEGTSSKFAYWVHYQGWNKKWDEWVEEDRLLKLNDENRKTLTEQPKPEKGASKSGVGSKRSRASANEETEESPVTKLEYKELTVKITGKLRHTLVKDWENITKFKKLVKLERKPNIAEIVTLFLDSKKRANSVQLLTAEVTTGIKVLFQNAIGRVLLYKFERPQFHDLSVEKKSVNYCEIYGAEHLLRLFVKIPELLKDSNLKPEELKVLDAKLSEFLRFLEKNYSKFFLKEYEPTDSEYQRRGAADEQ